MDRWDSRGRHEFLGATLCILAVIDTWRPTTSGLISASTELIVHLPNGDLTLTPRLASPVILMSVLMLYAAGRMSQVSVNIVYVFSAGIVWGIVVPLLAGLAVLAGWVPVPGALAGPLIVGGTWRLVELLALMVGIYAVMVSYQFLTNRLVPRWLAGGLAVLAGGTVQALLV
jgi:hypothetical protein